MSGGPSYRIPRPPQHAMLQGLARCGNRVQLVGSMGLGKSGALLLHARMLEFHLGYWPNPVVLAPLQVAYNWRSEVEAWLPGKRWSLVAGNVEQRKQALATSADVYLLTYDHLPWLHKYCPSSWGALGRMMVCDESQRVKHLRASWQRSPLGKVWLRTDGGVQTNALAQHATDFPFWVNATGTASPNGLTDLWGQYWFLDGGRRLGNSYSGFEDRFFRKPVRGGEFNKPQPLPGAEVEIPALVADITTVARVEDFYAVDQPQVIDRLIELPEAARKSYREMKARLATTIEHEGGITRVTASSAAAKVNRLLQIASGFAYAGDEWDPEVRFTVESHTAKLDAVESILQETNEPLVVVYYFTATLEALRKRFGKRLRELDKQGQAQDDWNAGKVEILALQYRSGSVGLSLQHGGRNICLVTPTYVADDYAQVLERLGPLRQMQSGYRRTVNVFRLIAARTEDQRVFDVATGKMDAERALYQCLLDLTEGR